MRLPAVVAAFLAVSTALPAQTPSAYSYEFRLEAHFDDGQHVVRGTVRVSGGRARVDLDTSARGGARGYYLLAQGGRVVYAVRPDKLEYDEFGAGEFTGELGKAFRFKGRGLKLTVRDVQFDSVRLGAGEPIAGHATQRVRLGVRWKLRARILLAKSDMPWSSEAEYWGDPAMPLMRNPMLEFTRARMLPVAAGDEAFWEALNGAHERLLDGSPLKADVRTTLVDRNGERQLSVLYEVTQITVGPVDESALEPPTGYRKSKQRRPWI